MTSTSTSLDAVSATLVVRDRAIVESLDLRLTAGMMVALVGPNGAGKTTALRLLAGEVAPSHGAVELDGTPLARVPVLTLARRRAVLPQETSIEFAFTAREVVELGRAPHRRTEAENDDPAVVADAMRVTDCSHLADRAFRSLSGGERARVSLARVIAQDTDYVLLDEPTAALDIRHQESVMGLAARLAADGRGVLAVVHDLNLAAAYATHVGLMQNGRLVAFGPPGEVLRTELLTEAYDVAVEVREHPIRGCPLVLAATPIDRSVSLSHEVIR
ncbi:MAG: heme ABC transporter ATP-binding protein [Acidimicrobiia bacterium]